MNELLGTHADKESKTGLYDVYYTSSNERVVVLGELSNGTPAEFSSLQEALLPHVGTFTVFYWLLSLSVMIYLVVLYIVLPLFNKVKR